MSHIYISSSLKGISIWNLFGWLNQKGGNWVSSHLGFIQFGKGGKMAFKNVSGYFLNCVDFIFIWTSKGRKEIGMFIYIFCEL